MSPQRKGRKIANKRQVNALRRFVGPRYIQFSAETDAALERLRMLEQVCKALAVPPHLFQ